MKDLSLIESVRSKCKAVAEGAIHVKINYDYIPYYASSLTLAQSIPPQLDAESHYLDHGDETGAFLVTLDTINFGSGYFPFMRKRPGMSGYFTIAHSLNDYFKNSGPFSAKKLTRLTIEDCIKLFDQEPGNRPILELMGLFTKALNDLGRYLLDSFNGSFIELIKAADSSVEKLVRLLIKMPYFNDVEYYDTIEVPFYKRAQLTAADLSLAFKGNGLGYFNDFDSLTIFADNLIPHVLRIDQTLIYEETLSTRIEAEELIESGSHEEIEIRACAVHVIELLKKEMKVLGKEMTSPELDYLLWNRGQKPHYKAIPRHRTRTVFY